MATDHPRPMRGALRALTVLRALNGGAQTMPELVRATGLPRASLHRLLETLSAAGYVSRRTDEKRFHLTALVRTLSDGFVAEDRVASAALPVLEALQREIVWPVGLVTFRDGAMLIRETTRRDSPLTNERITVGMTVPMLPSAAGRAYLAFCPEAERSAILAGLARSDAPADAAARHPSMVSRLLERTRRQGYGERIGDFGPSTASIAVPILGGDRVLGCLHVEFFARTMTPREIASRHLGAMQDAARRIAEIFDEPAPASITNTIEGAR